MERQRSGSRQLIVEGSDWRWRLRHWAVIQRDMLDRHPWITDMPMAAPSLAPNSLTFVERGLECMDGTALPDEHKLRIIGLISSYTLSEARMAHDAARARALSAASGLDDQGAPSWSYEALLREIVNDRDYRRLHRIKWSDAIGGDATGFKERDEFLFGLERILDGVAVLMEQPLGSRTRAGPQRGSIGEEIVTVSTRARCRTRWCWPTICPSVEFGSPRNPEVRT